MQAKKYILTAFLIFLVFFSGRQTDIRSQIKELLSKNEGIFAVAFKDLKDGETILINENEVFHAASTMKTAVQLETLIQVEKGRFSLDDSILIKNEFKSIVDGSSFSLSVEDDSETELYGRLGQKITLRAMMVAMITKSSNLATNIIIDLVGAINVNNSLQKFGIQGIKVLRGVEDTKAFEKGLNNTTTALGLMTLFEKIGNEEILPPQLNEELIQILTQQHFNEIIPAYLPPDVKVAHKTGSINGVQHDSGIVFLPEGRKYILVLLSKNLKDESASVKSMAEVSKILFEMEKSKN